MKRLIAIAAVLTLAACGGGDDAAEADAAGTDAASPAAVDMPAGSAGTYVGAGADGKEMTTTLAADGTFTDTVDGEVIRNGTWSDSIRGTCFVEIGVEGEACYSLGTPAADGTISVTGPDGTTTTMKKTG